VRILVTGGEGLVGRALRARAPAHGVELVAPGRDECDVSQDPAPLLAHHRPDVVLFCAAFTAVDACGPQHRAVNVEAPARWAALVPTWFLSSNFVLSGAGPHGPERRPAPSTVSGADGDYVAQKAEAEARVLAAGGHVARVGWVYGPGGRTFASRLCARLRAGETVRAVSDVLVQPTWSEDLADSLLGLPAGVTHHIGRETTTWYALAVAVQARLRCGRVEPVTQAALGLAAPRPRDARLAPAVLPGWTERLDGLVTRT
jgi:dTDP-4-dehydrorhamnose reductase